MDRKLKIVPKPDPDTWSVFEPTVGEILPVIKGVGDVNLLCGNCGARLVDGIKEGQVRNIIIHCPVCRFYVEIP